jgi:NADH-quinone oxidoreductase subunit L
VNLAGAITRVVANLDGAIDRYLVDGAVNLIANSTLSTGSILRRLQTGRIQTYLYGALVGAITIVLLNFLIK